MGRWPAGPEERARLTDELSVDDLLDRLDKVIARLAEAKEPIEDLVVAYEEGVRLLRESQARLERLTKEAGVPA
jgi:exodeoxyribonuclease VII small subunit